MTEGNPIEEALANGELKLSDDVATDVNPNRYILINVLGEADQETSDITFTAEGIGLQQSINLLAAVLEKLRQSATDGVGTADAGFELEYDVEP